MKSLSTATCALLAALACANAEAGQRDDAPYLPQFTVEMNFDDLVGRAASNTHVTTSLGLRSSLEVVDATQDAAYAAGGPISQRRRVFVPLLQLGATVQGIDTARVIGRNTLGDPRSSLTSGDSGGTGWIWWVAGGLATAGAIALAAGSGNSDDNQGGDCTLVGGGGSGTSPGVAQGCDTP